MFPTKVSLWLMTLLLSLACGLRVEQSKDFPLGSEVENLALRPSGSVLAVVYTFPRIYEVVPKANAEPKLVYEFQNTNGVSSITATSTPDVFYVITGNFSFETFSPTPGSYAIHRLSFDECDEPIVEDLAPLDAISQPNGLVDVPGTPYVLIADCRAGFVYRFNTDTLELTTYFDHPLLKPVAPPVLFGVNGIKLSRGYLYFSNTNQEIIARIRATGKEPSLSGEPEIVSPVQTSVDDFIVNDHNGDVYLAENVVNAIGFVSRKAYGTAPTTLLANISGIFGPTAARWAKGAEGRTLLVTVTGGFDQFYTKNFTGGGEVVTIHLD